MMFFFNKNSTSSSDRHPSTVLTISSFYPGRGGGRNDVEERWPRNIVPSQLSLGRLGLMFGLFWTCFRWLFRIPGSGGARLKITKELPEQLRSLRDFQHRRIFIGSNVPGET